MKKTDLEYEYIIKGLIDANMIEFDFPEKDSYCTAFKIKYMDKEFDISLHEKTSREVYLGYFYQKIMEG